MNAVSNVRTRLAMLLVAVLLATLVMGCLPIASASEAEQVTLKVLTYDDDFWGRYIDAFMAENPNIIIERKLNQTVDTGAIQVVLASDDAPDVLMVNSGPGRVLPLAEAGMLMDLTEYYESRGWREKVVPYVMDALANFDDRIFEVVDNIDVFQVYYNKSIFADVGVEPPTTWDEFIEVMETLKANDVTPFVIGGSNNFMLGWFAGNIFQSANGFETMTDIIYGDTSWNSPGMLKAYETMVDFMQKGYINMDAVAITDMEARTRHAVGQGAMAVIGNGYLNTFVDQEICSFEDFGTFMMPSMIGGAATPTAGLAQSWVVNKSTKNLDACLTFLEFSLGEGKLDFLIAEESGAAPASIVPPGKALFSDAQAAVDAVADGSGYNPSVFTTANVKTAYYESNQAVLTGQKTPQQAIETIQAAKEVDKAD